MKKILAILLVVCMAFALLACNSGDSNDGGSTDAGNAGGSDNAGGNAGGGGSSDGGSSDGGSGADTGFGTGPVESGSGGYQGEVQVSARDTVTMAITQDRGTLDPFYTVGWDNQQCMRLIYEPLWEYDQDYDQIRWVLATGVDDSDPLKWIITLRDDVYFANGNQFTAEDALFSLYLANNREGEPPYFRTMNNDLNRKIDDFTIEVVYDEFRVGTMLSYATIFMYDEESYDFDTVAMETNGTGPFEVQEYIIGSHLNLTQRDNYWGTPPPIKNVIFRVLIEEAQRVNALQTGEVDISSVPFQDVDYVRDMPGVEVRLVPARSTRAVFANVTYDQSPFYNNRDARLALFHAIDPQGILDVVYNGFGEIARCPYTMYAADAREMDFDKGIYAGGVYNPELARELAISSGLVDWCNNNQMRFINNGSPDMVTTAELVQGYLRDIGVNIEVQSYDAGSWLAYRFDATSFDMCVDFAGGSPAATDLAIWWIYAGNCDAQGDPEYLERYRYLADTILTITDPVVLGEYYTEMTDILSDVAIFHNYVDMMTAQATSTDLAVNRINGPWIDWMTLYWIR